MATTESSVTQDGIVSILGYLAWWTIIFGFCGITVFAAGWLLSVPPHSPLHRILSPSVSKERNLIVRTTAQANQWIREVNTLAAFTNSATELDRLTALSNDIDDIKMQAKESAQELEVLSDASKGKSSELLAAEELIAELKLEIDGLKTEIEIRKRCNSDLFESKLSNYIDEKKLAKLEKRGNTKEYLAYLKKIVVYIKNEYAASMKKFGCPNDKNLDAFLAFFEMRLNNAIQMAKKEAKENSKFSKFLSHPMVNTILGVALAQIPVIANKINGNNSTKDTEEISKSKNPEKPSVPAQNKEKTPENKISNSKEKAVKRRKPASISSNG